MIQLYTKEVQGIGTAAEAELWGFTLLLTREFPTVTWEDQGTL